RGGSFTTAMSAGQPKFTPPSSLKFREHVQKLAPSLSTEFIRRLKGEPIGEPNLSAGVKTKISAVRENRSSKKTIRQSLFAIRYLLSSQLTDLPIANFRKDCASVVKCRKIFLGLKFGSQKVR
ncbi:MAG: hypothetical protein SQA66_10575, partial [Candidatus Fervidibacter sacchari]